MAARHGGPGIKSIADLIAFMRSRFDYSAFEWRGRLEPLRTREQWSYDNLIFMPSRQSAWNVAGR